MSRERHLARSRPERRSRSLGEILARKRELVERCAVQRSALAGHVDGLAPVFTAGDKVLGVGRYLLARPLLLVAAGGILVAFWPRGVFSLAMRGFALWNGARTVRKLIAARG